MSVLAGAESVEWKRPSTGETGTIQAVAHDRGAEAGESETEKHAQRFRPRRWFVITRQALALHDRLRLGGDWTRVESVERHGQGNRATSQAAARVMEWSD